MGRQSSREKTRDERFQALAEEPQVPILTVPFPNGQANAGFWLGTKDALYNCAQSANSIYWVLFVSLYTTAIVSLYLSGSFTKVVLAKENFIS